MTPIKRAAACVALATVVAGATVTDAGARRAVFVSCQRPYRSSFVAVQRPRRCILDGIPNITANVDDLLRMHWSAWGGAIARGTGRIQANHADSNGHFPTYPVSIELYRIRPGCRGQFYYTRANQNGSPDGTIVLPTHC